MFCVESSLRSNIHGVTSHSVKDAVQLSFQHTEDEYLAAMRVYFWHATGLQTRVIFTYVLFAAAIVVLPMLLGFSVPLWANLIVLAFAAAAWFHRYTIDLPRAYFRSDPKFRDEYHLTLTDAGIEFHTENMSSMIAWNFYGGMIESKNFYMLIYGRNTHSLSIIPKRAFQSNDQETTFRQILRRNLAPNLKLSAGERDQQQYVSEESKAT